MSDDLRRQRHRTYSLVAMVLTCALAIVAMAGFLRLGERRLDERVYRDPVLTLRALGEAQNRFRRRIVELEGARRYAASFAELEEVGGITHRLARGAVGDYRYRLLHGDAEGWAIAGSPAEVTSQSLFYYMDQSQAVRAHRGAPADAESTVYWHPLRGLMWPGG